MRQLREAWRRVWFLVRRSREQAEMDEEMRFHLECREEEARAAGVDPHEARYVARRAFGNPTRLRETGLEMWGWGWLDRLAQDVRWAARTLRRSRGFTVAAVLTLGLGIGVNTAVFTFVRAHLLRPLPYPHAGRLVWVFESSRSFMPGEAIEAQDDTVTAWRDHARTLEALGTFASSRKVLTGVGDAEELSVGAVSPSLLSILGASAWRGRLFSEAENRVGHDAVAVLSHATWLARFGGSDGAVGREIVLGGRACTIVGVMAPGFGFAPLDRPHYSWSEPKDVGVWVPVTTESDPRQTSGRFYLGVLARLRDGATPAQAQEELSQIAAGATGGRSSAIVAGLQQELVKKARTPLLLLTAAAGFVLLIVCANVAHLQLARGMARAREMAIRVAIGAGRGRLVRQLLVESTVLSLAGAGLGLLAVRAAMDALVWLAGRELPWGTVSVDGWVLSFTMASAVLAALLFGLLPARQAARVDPHASLKDGGRGPAGHVRRTTGLLVVAEIALALVLVSCAGLMINTVWRLQHAPMGFRTDGLVTLSLKAPAALSRDDHRLTAFLEQFLARVRALPGVEAAEVANTLPMGGSPTFNGFTVVGSTPAPGPRPTAQYRVVTPGYFRTLGIPLRRGRIFTDADRGDAQPVAIVNEAMERRYFGGQAIGKRLVQGMPRPVEIVGVVGDIRHETLRSDPLPEVYHPLAQRLPWRQWVVVRTAAGVDGTAGAVRALLREVQPDAVVTDVKSMEQRRAESLGTSRFLVWLLATFAGLALVLALIGSYGVVDYWVSRRRQEFGVRLALGASGWRVVRLVLGETLGLVVGATVLGMAGAMACTRLLASYLYQVEPTDPATLAAAVLLVLLTAVAAAGVPARRAAGTDPVVALRQE